MGARESSMLSLRSARPLGIPPLFLLDALQRDRARPVDQRAAVRALLTEYLDVDGTSFAWGQIIEAHVAPFRTWRIVPVALWEQFAGRCDSVPLNIPGLNVSLAPLVRTLIASRLPRGVLLAGIQAEGRRHRYALLTLLLADPVGAVRVRRWLQRRFLSELLPVLLARSEAALHEQLDRINDPTSRSRATAP